MNEQNGQEPGTFVVTKSYRLFAEMCDACRQSRFIGLSMDLPGPEKRRLPDITPTGPRWNHFYRNP